MPALAWLIANLEQPLHQQVAVDAVHVVLATAPHCNADVGNAAALALLVMPLTHYIDTHDTHDNAPPTLAVAVLSRTMELLATMRPVLTTADAFKTGIDPRMTPLQLGGVVRRMVGVAVGVVALGVQQPLPLPRSTLPPATPSKSTLTGEAAVDDESRVPAVMGHAFAAAGSTVAALLLSASPDTARVDAAVLCSQYDSIFSGMKLQCDTSSGMLFICVDCV